jgi:hypothetical protein
MTDQSADDRSGFERRDLLKGLGFGAVGTGLLAGQASGRRVQPEPTSMIDYAVLVPPGADPDEPQTDPVNDGPTAGLDLVFQLDAPGLNKSATHTIAYALVLVDKNSKSDEKPRVVTSAFEDGRTRSFAGTVRTTPGGETRRREEFSVAGLGPDNPVKDDPYHYWAVLIVSDLSGLPDQARADYAAEDFTVRHPMQDTESMVGDGTGSDE